jgi:hypothetical protein
MHFQFPPLLGELMMFFKPLVAAIHGFVALECVHGSGFYMAWKIEVFVIPGAFWLGTFLYYLSRRATVGEEEARSKMYNEAFFVLFMVGTHPHGGARRAARVGRPLARIEQSFARCGGVGGGTETLLAAQFYPLITNKLFKMLDCRQIGPEDEFLASDYSIDCTTAEHKAHYWLSVVRVLRSPFAERKSPCADAIARPPTGDDHHLLIRRAGATLLR